VPVSLRNTEPTSESQESKYSLEGKKRGLLASFLPDSFRGSYASSGGGGRGSDDERTGGRRMGGYPIMTIEEAMVDGRGCVGDDDEDDKVLVGEEERGFGEHPL